MTATVVHVASGREWRGGQRQTWLLARELARLGLDQRVVTGAGSELAGRLEASGVPVRAVRWRAGLDPRAILAVRDQLRSPALLHAHDAHALSVAGIARWRRPAPLVVTRRVDFHLRRAGYWRRADRVIAISDAVAAVLRQDGIPPERIRVVHSGVDLEAAEHAAPGAHRLRFGIPADRPVAVHLGALVPHKDQVTMVRAAGLARGRAPLLHWIIAGEGPLRAELARAIAEERMEDRVHLAGQVADPLGLLAEADAFVMSSREEGLGTSVLDAMARGIPVASTAAGGLPEMLADGAGLLVPVGDASALADAVVRIVHDRALAERLAARGKEAVRRFSAARMAGEVLTVYRSFGKFGDGS
ncbi:MAG TPA: glycosyltransferase [Gemmatimonadales bacterium]|nr:glycosyltransferase [Gemmatimonadales bacterium]